MPPSLAERKERGSVTGLNSVGYLSRFLVMRILDTHILDIKFSCGRGIGSVGKFLIVLVLSKEPICNFLFLKAP